MGSRGPVAKRAPRSISSEPLAEFDPPADMCSEARILWATYWSDPVSTAPTQADRVILLRWIENVNRYLVMVAAGDESPLVKGSQDQLVESPYYKVAERALTAAERCEKQLGIGALNRAGLGIAIVNEKRSLSDLNRAYEERTSADSHEASEASDPRVVSITSESSRLVS